MVAVRGPLYATDGPNVIGQTIYGSRKKAIVASPSSSQPVNRDVPDAPIRALAVSRLPYIDVVANDKPARIVCAAFPYTGYVDPRPEGYHARVDGNTLGADQGTGSRMTSEVITSNHESSERDTRRLFRWCGAGDGGGRRRRGGREAGLAYEVATSLIRRRDVGLLDLRSSGGWWSDQC